MEEKTNHYFYELPTGYKEDYVIDAKDKKIGLIFNLVCILVTIGVILIMYLLKGLELYIYVSKFNIFAYLVFLVTIFVYLIFHELTHGLFYKIYTKEKLTFGLTLFVAFCGVPKIYVKKKAMMVTILAPFVVYTIVFGLICYLLRFNDLYYLLASCMLGIHVGGCVGDLYGFGVMLFKYHKKDILVNDTGPKQTFYVLNE